MYYILCAEEFVEVLNGDEYISYRGTNWALNGAPIGACSGEATVTGSNPYICDACATLIQGKSSPLLRKLYHSKLLKHPREEQLRATKTGVTHKYCSSASLVIAVQHRHSEIHVQKHKLEQAEMRLLHDSWHCSSTTKPYIKALVTIIESGDL